MTCLAIGTSVLMLADPTVHLSWFHSVEHVEWQEHWRVGATALSLETARVRGSGAGMEPDPDARLIDGWWEWRGDLTVPSLSLAASGATGAGWTLCFDGACTEIGLAAGAPLTMRPCENGSAVATESARLGE